MDSRPDESEAWEYTVEKATIWDLPHYRDGYDAARLHVWEMIRDLILEAQRHSSEGAKAPEVRILSYLLSNTWFSEWQEADRC